MTTTSYPLCGSSEHACASGTGCVRTEQLCDGRMDCIDGSDEDSTIKCASEFRQREGGGRSEKNTNKLDLRKIRARTRSYKQDQNLK